jgi:hypothetical protein
VACVSIEGPILRFETERHKRFRVSRVFFEIVLGGEKYLPLPIEFGCCHYAVLQCCDLKDECTLRDHESSGKSGNSSLFQSEFQTSYGKII